MLKIYLSFIQIKENLLSILTIEFIIYIVTIN